LPLPDQAEMVERDDVLRIDVHGALERLRRLVEPPLVEEGDRETEVRRCRRRIELDRTARRTRAFRHRAAPVVAERELEMRRGIAVLELQAALEGARRVTRLPEMVVCEAQVEVGARVVGIALQHREAAIPHALGEAELQLATLVETEGCSAVLAE